MLWLSLIFGVIVGLSLGLTGGGGAIFAVPMLVYGLHIPAREAVSVSLVAVGMTSLIGFWSRWRLRQVEIHTGLIFAAAGMAGAPVGSWIASQLNETLLLCLFAGVMLIVAGLMWQQAARTDIEAATCATPDSGDGPTCQRDAAGQLLLTSRCAALLLFIGVLTGILSGLFGVGGGFIIVPSLVLFSGMSIQRAVGTSLMVIALVSAAGVTARLFSGATIPLDVTALFVVSGIAGLFAGQWAGRRMSASRLQRVFALAILAVAVFVIVRNLQA